MDGRFRVAAVQINANADKAANLAAAGKLIEEGASRGAQLVALPELFNCLGPPDVMRAAAEPIPGETSTWLADTARRLNIWLLGGSLAEASDDPQRVFNTSLLFNPQGNLVSRYRKIHLFDIDIPGQVTVRESSWCRPGEEVVITELPWGNMGQATCYDLRFPELFRRLADREVVLIAIPSAFTLATGRDHWELLVRARAVENQAYVVAPNQYGPHSAGLVSYGRSMIVDPWGTPLAVAPDGNAVIVADVDLGRLADVRARLPALSHRRGLERQAPTKR